MKRPNISFDKEAILQFLLDHGEKIGVAIVGALACGLVWGGVSAARTQSAGRHQQPSVIEEQAGRAATHIQAVKRPPAEELRRTNLSKSIEPWRAPELQAVPPVALFDKPLFEEKSKRSKPEVFPIEDLRAVAGIAFMQERLGNAAAARNPVDIEAPENPGDQPDGSRRRRKPPDPAAPANARGRLLPYCVVTGLIPFARQMGDYQERFSQAGFRDPQLDVPSWSDYLVERSVVTTDGKDEWKRIDLKKFFADAPNQWADLQGEHLPPGATLAAERNPGAAFSYCSPLPVLAGEQWGPEAIHPWFVNKFRESAAEQARLAAEQAEQAATIPPGQQAGAGPTVGAPRGEFGLGFGPGAPLAVPGAQGEFGVRPGPMMDAQGPVSGGLEYRLFRFVDTSVEIGKTYRYRVRLSLLNPNRDLEARYLADPALARDVKLASAASNVSAPVTVPATSALLVRVLRKAESKRFKPGAVEVLVLDKGSETGDLTLRGLVTDPGGLVNVDKRLNKPGDARTRGEDVFTEAVLVDVRGKQDDRAETRGAKASPPPEPLALLFLLPDGRFAATSAADAQLKVDRYIGTLPVGDDPKPGRDKQPPGPGPESPFGSPFGR